MSTRWRIAIVVTLALKLAAGAWYLSAREGPVAATQGPVTPSEAYLLEQAHTAWAHSAAIVWNDLYYACGDVSHVDSTRWPDNRTITVHYEGANDAAGGPLVVEFTNLRYDPEHSTIHYGKSEIAKSVDETLKGEVYLYDLRDEAEKGQFRQTDAITLAQSRSVTVTKGLEFNVTVSSETTIGAGEAFPGPSFEQKIGVEAGFSTSEEQSRAAEESKEQTVEHEFDVELEPLRATLIKATSPEETEYTPIDAVLVADFGVKFTLHSPVHRRGHCAAAPARHAWQGGQEYVLWHGNLDIEACGWQVWDKPYAYQLVQAFKTAGFNGSGTCTVAFESIDRFAQMLTGVHERWPGLDPSVHGISAAATATGWTTVPPAVKAQFYGPLRHTRRAHHPRHRDAAAHLRGHGERERADVRERRRRAEGAGRRGHQLRPERGDLLQRVAVD